MKKIGFPILALLLVSMAYSQNSSRLKVFIDCSSTWCDLQFIRTEINIVDFVLDNVAADVHILITSQRTGSGGDEFQLIFFGQNNYRTLADTLRFVTDPNATDFEERDLMLKYIKSGLIPFVLKSGAIGKVEISLKSTDTSVKVTSSEDPWKAWVMRVGIDGNMNGDANYTNKNYYGNASANKITEKFKTGIGFNFGWNKSVYEYEENGSVQKFVVNNNSWSANQYVVGSINKHWSWAYDVRFSRNSFNNNRGRAFVRLAAEYNIFPYHQVNNKLLTISYGITARRNHYFDSTIYNKTKETLYGHRATAYLSLNQKWGNSYAGVTYQNYFHNWKFFNLGVDVYTNVRITGGLSFFVLVFGGLTRDQVFLVKGNASPEEVLARKRQLASGYNYYSSVGIFFRFGSKLNNVVNRRFDRSGSGNDD